MSDFFAWLPFAGMPEVILYAMGAAGALFTNGLALDHLGHQATDVPPCSQALCCF